jgi:hypothetical protein
MIENPYTPPTAAIRNSVHQTKVAKLLAALLVVGGVTGIGLALWMGYQFIQIQIGFIVLAAAFMALFVWSGIAGIRLWRGEAKGWKWAAISFALQIPVLTVPGLRYEFYTGLSLKLVGGNVKSPFGFNLGAGLEFYLNTEITGLVYGANLFAIAALIYLLRRRPNKNMQPNSLHGST